MWTLRLMKGPAVEKTVEISSIKRIKVGKMGDWGLLNI